MRTYSDYERLNERMKMLMLSQQDAYTLWVLEYEEFEDAEDEEESLPITLKDSWNG